MAYMGPDNFKIYHGLTSLKINMLSYIFMNETITFRK